MGKCGTSAKAPFVLTPSGSSQVPQGPSDSDPGRLSDSECPRLKAPLRRAPERVRGLFLEGRLDRAPPRRPARVANNIIIIIIIIIK